jgi:hypothetical protein
MPEVIVYAENRDWLRFLENESSKRLSKRILKI